MSLKTLLLVFALALSLSILAACGGRKAAPTEEPAAPTIEEPVVADEAEGAEEAVAAEEPAENASSDSGETATGMRRFTVVPAESTAAFLVDEEFFGGALAKYGIAAGEYDIVGSTQAVDGYLEIDVAEGVVGANEFTVQMNTLATDQSRRDRWIRTNGPRFDDHPVATFVARGAENAPAEYNEGAEVTFQLVGDLTVREVTVPATFDVTASLAGNTLSGVAVADLHMSDFGIEPPSFANTLTVQDPFKVRMELTAVEE